MSNTEHKHIALVGFANTGKTSLFNQLTQSEQSVGNWAGVTVSVKQKKTKLNEHAILLSDLPGIPSLSKQKVQSQDLSISQNFINKQDIDLIINVVDTTQLQRQLYLSSQLLELNIPMVIVLTKADRPQAIQVNLEKLSAQLACPVIEIDSRSKTSVNEISKLLDNVSNATTQKPSLIEVPESIKSIACNKGLSLLDIESKTSEEQAETNRVEQDALIIMQARYSFIKQLLDDCKINKKTKQALSDKLDNIILHPLLGIPIFLLAMYLLFMFAINVGSAFIDFFDILSGAIFVDYPQHYLSLLNPPTWLLTIIEGIGSGLQTVATFIPVIACLFIGLSLLESSGYLARAAFVIESLMQKIGLPGKAFVPLIVGFGCTVPAVMSARVLDSERERITTVLMSPFMSCGARLPVYALFAAAFFPESGQNIVFLLYLIGIAAAIFTGFLLKITLLPGSSSANIMELPLYELPQLKALFKRVWQRTRSFILGAGKTIVIVVCILNFFNSLGTDGQFGHQDSSSSILSQGAQIVTPALSPMGIKEDNWQASVGIITGIFAKEALVATFNNLYSPSDSSTQELKQITELWLEAINSIYSNLLGIEPRDPLGIDVGELSNLTQAAAEQDVNLGTYHAMQNAFAGQLGAFSYLLFILLYTPCAAAMGAIKNEVGSRWAGFSAIWSFAFAYLMATACFQIGHFSAQPITASVHIIAVGLCFFLSYLWLKHRGSRILSIPTVVSYK